MRNLAKKSICNEACNDAKQKRLRCLISKRAIYVILCNVKPKSRGGREGNVSTLFIISLTHFIITSWVPNSDICLCFLFNVRQKKGHTKRWISVHVISSHRTKQADFLSFSFCFAQSVLGWNCLKPALVLQVNCRLIIHSLLLSHIR